MGWKKSFFTLLQLAGDYDYYAFADQDDYWYRPYTEEEMNKFLKKQIPDAKEINFRG